METNVNQKYVNLLQSTFEKYRSLNKLGSVEDNDEDEGVEEIPAPSDNVEIKTTSKTVRKNASKYDVRKLLKKSFNKYQNIDKVEPVQVRKASKPAINDEEVVKIDSKCKNSKVKETRPARGVAPKNIENKEINKSGLMKKGKRMVTKRNFTKEEDKMILEAYRSAGLSDTNKRAPNGFLKDLGLKLKRKGYSISTRHTLLKTKKSRLHHVLFTLLDDKAIIDAAVESVKKVGNISKANIKNKNEIATKLSRSKYNVSDRWMYTLKPWIMCYHAKTLNLDIRIMLATFVAENFNTVYDIDWEQVLERPEMAGHNVGTIRFVFGQMTQAAASHLQKRRDEVSLSEIVEDAKRSDAKLNVRKISEATKKRQMEIIEYFESVIKPNNIKNFL